MPKQAHLSCNFFPIHARATHQVFLNKAAKSRVVILEDDYLVESKQDIRNLIVFDQLFRCADINVKGLFSPAVQRTDHRPQEKSEVFWIIW